MGNKKLRLAFVMDTSLGLNSVYLNWKRLFTNDAIKPIWITAGEERKFDWISKLPGISKALANRLQVTAELRSKLRRSSPDAQYFSNMALLPLFGDLKRRPTFTTLDSTQIQLQAMPAYGIRPNKREIVESMLHRRRSLAYQSCAALFPWSEWVKNSLINDYGVEQQPIYVTPPGIDLGQWPPYEPRDMRRGDIGTKNILFVGGDFQRKGGPLLMDWAASQTREDFHVDFVTKFSPEQPQTRMAFHNGLTPGSTRLAELYRTADVFVLPTLADVNSLAGCEALACGVPTIITNVGACNEIVRNGLTGYCIAASDSGELDVRLTELLDNSALRSKMSTEARRDAEARFDARRSIRETTANIISYT